MSKINYLERLKDCCVMRGLSQQLIHRTIHEFDWFCSAVILGEKSENQEEKEIYEKYSDFRYCGEDTLEKWIALFFDYCKNEYLVKNNVEKREY